MAGLRPGHPRLSCSDEARTWMPGTSPGMTSFGMEPVLLAAFLSQRPNSSTKRDRSRRGMDDHRARDREHRPDQQRRKTLFAPGQRPPVRLLRPCEIVEDGDRRDGVVGRIDHVIGHEALDIADDRDGAFLDPARQFLGRSGFCRGLTDGGIHEILLPAAKSRGRFAPRTQPYAMARNRSTPSLLDRGLLCTGAANGGPTTTGSPSASIDLGMVNSAITAQMPSHAAINRAATSIA